MKLKTGYIVPRQKGSRPFSGSVKVVNKFGDTCGGLLARVYRELYTESCIQGVVYRELHTGSCIQGVANRELHTGSCIQGVTCRELHTGSCIQGVAYREW